MRKAIIACASAIVMSAAAAAHAANEWGIDYEEKSRLDGKVVDILCELTGNCPANCGDGTRQLGLLQDDGRLLLVLKNFDAFAGGVNDLIGFCGKQITADGLYIPNPKMPMFAIQFKRLAPDGKWSRANQFGKDWSKANGGAKSNKWFRSDATVKKLIDEQGIFGLPGVKLEE